MDQDNKSALTKYREELVQLNGLKNKKYFVLRFLILACYIDSLPENEYTEPAKNELCDFMEDVYQLFGVK